MRSVNAVAGACVLLTTDAVGGVLTYTLDLAAGLAEAGATVRIAVLGPTSPAALAALSRFDAAVLDHPLEWLAAAPGEVRAAAAAVAAAARDCDLAHLHSPAFALASFPCPVVAVHHSCVATWWAAVRDGALPADLRWRAALVGEGMRRAGVVAVPSRAHADAVTRCYGLATPPTVVRNGRAAPAPAAPADNAAHGEEAHERRLGPRDLQSRAATGAVFTAGRLWDEAKNLGVLDRAAAMLPWPVRAAGEVTGRNWATLALTYIETLGPLGPAEMRRHLAARPIYASPALYEPFGLAVLEAAQSGCPLVLADIASFRELWDGAAVFVDPRDPAAWVEALGALIADPARRNGLSAAALARSARFGVEAMVAATLRVHAALRAGAPVPADAA